MFKGGRGRCYDPPCHMRTRYKYIREVSGKTRWSLSDRVLPSLASCPTSVGGTSHCRLRLPAPFVNSPSTIDARARAHTHTHTHTRQKSIWGDLLVWREHSSLFGYKLVVGKCRGLEAVDRRSPKQMSAENTSRPTTTPSSDEPPALPFESSTGRQQQ